MIAIEGIRDEPADRSFGIVTAWATPDTIWVKMAWTVLEAANGLGDEIAIEACQRVIDDDLDGDLPAQSDMNTIFGFLDAHAH
jgi:hypothetical protein